MSKWVRCQRVRGCLVPSLLPCHLAQRGYGIDLFIWICCRTTSEPVQTAGQIGSPSRGKILVLCVSQTRPCKANYQRRSSTFLIAIVSIIVCPSMIMTDLTWFPHGSPHRGLQWFMCTTWIYIYSIRMDDKVLKILVCTVWFVGPYIDLSSNSNSSNSNKCYSLHQ